MLLALELRSFDDEGVSSESLFFFVGFFIELTLGSYGCERAEAAQDSTSSCLCVHVFNVERCLNGCKVLC